jgi:hypothetical protein
MKRAACLLVVFWFLALAGAMAQTGVDAAILGEVTDPNGGAVAGAQVQVTNLDTGIQKTAMTGSDGGFEVAPLPKGYYSVSVSFAGFKTWTLPRVEVIIGDRKRVSPILQVGDVNERVTVEATAELLQTEKAEAGGVIEERTIRELPLNGRDVVELAQLLPGVRYGGKDFTSSCANGNMSRVQGLGHRDDQSEFRVDGVASNSVCDEGGTAIPNPDTIAQFNVSTSNFSAENGRNPLLITMVTKSGTNEYHGTLYEFLRNDALNARNTFANSTPKLSYNQFGVAGGGPFIKNKTFFFGSYEGIRRIQARVYNSPTVSDPMLRGDFSGLPPITDPLSGKPFPGNRIPQDRFSQASVFFFPWILRSNSAGDVFRANASVPTHVNEFTGRVDHQITPNQRIYGRYYHVDTPQTILGNQPSISAGEDTHSYSLGLNYDYTITPSTLFNLSLGTVNTVNTTTPECSGTGVCSEIGKRNLTEEAGIQGFPTAGREEWIGLPDVISFGNYTGISSRGGWGDPSTFKSQSINGNVSLSLVRGRHTIVTGYQYTHLYLIAGHGSCCSKGVFDFNGQVTGNPFGDYLLGYTDNSLRNYPIHTFGMKSNPYGALFVNDSWKISSRFTAELGVRWDHWFAKSFVRGAGGTFDPKTGKAIAGEDKNGKVDLTAQPVSPFLAKATEGQWIPASQAGVPGGLFEPTGYVSPRLGLAWRPTSSGDLVIRAGFGIFTSSYRGNITGSQIIAPPYWTFESQSWSPAQLQRWETAWPVNPNSFVASSISAAAYDVKPIKDKEWNISVQKSLPFKSAITLSYVGSAASDLIVDNSLNNVPPGLYTDLQAAKPYPVFGSIDLYLNSGTNHYHSGQLKLERRFENGLSYMLSYAFSKNISENSDHGRPGDTGIWTTPTPFAPAGYNRGRTNYDHTHILASNVVWEIPVGRGHRAGGGMNPVLNGVIGGWELSGIYLFSSGDPLTFGVQGNTLGNGWSTRPNLIGNPGIANPSADLWFNPNAFAEPGPYLFGNSGIGILDGPASHIVNLALMKKFRFGESRYLQFRWEAFNAFNHVNLRSDADSLNTTIGQSTTGKIFAARDARQMQIALKFVF